MEGRGGGQFCLTPDSNDWLERHRVKGVAWCKFKCQLGKWVEWSGVEGFITPSRFGAIIKYEIAAVFARASGKSLMQEQWSVQRKCSLKAQWIFREAKKKKKIGIRPATCLVLQVQFCILTLPMFSWKSVWDFEKWKLDPGLLALVPLFRNGSTTSSFWESCLLWCHKRPLVPLTSVHLLVSNISLLPSQCVFHF